MTSPTEAKKRKFLEQSNFPNRKLNMEENSDPHDNNSTAIRTGKQKLVSNKIKCTDPPSNKPQVNRGSNPFDKGNSAIKPAMKTTCPDFNYHLFCCSTTPHHQMAIQVTTTTIGSHDESFFQTPFF